VTRAFRGPLRTKEQAAQIAWRIVKDWTEAQLAATGTTLMRIASFVFRTLDGVSFTYNDSNKLNFVFRKEYFEPIERV
jgi:hypothetical protein